MAISSKLFPAILLLVLLLATETGPVREAMAAGRCQRAWCKKCTGSCFDPEECAISCRNEGYDSGECTSAYHCTCSKNC